MDRTKEILRWAGYLEMVQSGDESKLTDLYLESFDYVYNSAYQKLRDDNLSQEVVQETFIKFFKNYKDIENPRAYLDWIRRVSTNTAIDMLRKMDKKESLFSEMLVEREDSDIEVQFGDTDDVTPLTLLEEKDLKNIINKLIKQIPENQRIVMLMVYVDEFTIKETANLLDLSENTVKSRLRLGRKKMMQLVLEEEEKHDIKLHTLSPIAIFIFLFGDANKVEASSYAKESILNEAMNSSVTDKLEGGKQIQAGNKISEKLTSDTLSKVANKTVLSKLTIVAIATVSVIGVTIGIKSLADKDDKSVDLKVDKVIEDIKDEQVDQNDDNKLQVEEDNLLNTITEEDKYEIEYFTNIFNNPKLGILFNMYTKSIKEDEGVSSGQLENDWKIISSHAFKENGQIEMGGQDSGFISYEIDNKDFEAILLAIQNKYKTLDEFLNVAVEKDGNKYLYNSFPSSGGTGLEVKLLEEFYKKNETSIQFTKSAYNTGYPLVENVKAAKKDGNIYIEFFESDASKDRSEKKQIILEPNNGLSTENIRFKYRIKDIANNLFELEKMGEDYVISRDYDENYYSEIFKSFIGNSFILTTPPRYGVFGIEFLNHRGEFTSSQRDLSDARSTLQSKVADVDGRFRVKNKISNYVYELELSDYFVTSAGKEDIDEGNGLTAIHTSNSPYFSNNHTYTLFLKGTPLNEMSEDLANEVNDRDNSAGLFAHMIEIKGPQYTDYIYLYEK